LRLQIELELFLLCLVVRRLHLVIDGVEELDTLRDLLERSVDLSCSAQSERACRQRPEMENIRAAVQTLQLAGRHGESEFPVSWRANGHVNPADSDARIRFSSDNVRMYCVRSIIQGCCTRSALSVPEDGVFLAP
jgi:hypothetical protein